MNQEIDVNTIESCALQITQKPTLDICITGWDSFRYENRDYKLVEKGRWLIFEAHWKSVGLTNNDHTHRISIPLERWEEAKQIYSEWLKKQNESKICTPDNG